MIRRLILENFKGIKEGNIELEPLSIFIGSNNSGKTSILEALYLAPNPVRKAPYLVNGQIASSARVIHHMHETLDSKGYVFLMNNYYSKHMEIKCLSDDDTLYVLKFEIRGDNIQISSVQRKEKLIDPTDLEAEDIVDSWLDDFATEKVVSQLSCKAEHTDIQNEAFFENSLFINDDLLKNAYDFFRENWATIVNTGILSKVAKKASELSNDKYSNFTIEPHLSNQLSFNAYFKLEREFV